MLFHCSTASAQKFDLKLLNHIRNDRNTSLDGMMCGFSQSMYPVSIGVPLGQLVVGYATGNQTTIRNGWTSTAALGITLVATYGLKYGVQRQRPYTKHPDMIIPESYGSDPSFPSGHTSTAFVTATSLSLQYPKWYVIVPSYLWAGTVSYSRMHLGKHYPSDVLAGALIGTGSAYLTHKMGQWLEGKKHRRESDWFNPITAALSTPGSSPQP
ncbi:phosphatase PAP2 family protein [Chitinophaga agrisoli]|uniref:Phosphatase PAP2 family protein n=2 Tax=Chitinophaga agrisoli TaxID=2607653 RepID=A0A5B2VRR1_9BACT|nr:phosphatase PAP2 family protein [Chitinophaga agrisoli]